ncbi:hypothetical protein AVEN_190854-1 [Araneus ventricosus]|uniref:Uncharacterized protein n=1 Tax=Araneus ventricosus TaxID=182803 RepID=A0A4Y2CR76_ARAVE|nr:hypothetical protein AVEN_190854-1 [Araneus ventricosus]
MEEHRTRNGIFDLLDHLEQGLCAAAQFELSCRHVNKVGRIDAPAKCEVHDVIRFFPSRRLVCGKRSMELFLIKLNDDCEEPFCLLELSSFMISIALTMLLYGAV